MVGGFSKNLSLRCGRLRSNGLIVSKLTDAEHSGSQRDLNESRCFERFNAPAINLESAETQSRLFAVEN